MEILTVRHGVEPPETGTCFMLARNGIMMQIDNDWVMARVPVKEIKSLTDISPRAELRLPPVDAAVFAKAAIFFQQVFKRHGTEAAILLHYSPTLGWELTVPKQRVSRAAVRYDMQERLEGYRCVGTMHSHGSMAASHSSVDTRDEADFDGVHVTIGGLNNFPSFDMDAELTVRSFRFALDASHFAGVSEVKKDETETPYSTGSWWSTRRKLFTCDRDILGDWCVPEEWFEKVEIAHFGRISLKTPVPTSNEGTEEVRFRQGQPPWAGAPIQTHPVHEYRPYTQYEPDVLDRMLNAVVERCKALFTKKGSPE